MFAPSTAPSTILPTQVLVVLEQPDPQSLRTEARWVATPVWANVDRPISYSISFGNGPKGEKLARRYQAAVMAGAVFTDTKVLTDIYGNTYVGFSSKVMGKYANADLKRLGF